jgi:hypothetical protein
MSEIGTQVMLLRHIQHLNSSFRKQTKTHLLMFSDENSLIYTNEQIILFCNILDSRFTEELTDIQRSDAVYVLAPSERLLAVRLE